MRKPIGWVGLLSGLALLPMSVAVAAEPGGIAVALITIILLLERYTIR